MKRITCLAQYIRRLLCSQTRRKADNKRWSEEISFRAACDDRTLLRELAHLTQRYRNSNHFVPRSISVMIHGINGEDFEQTDLFYSIAQQDEKRRMQSERLSATLDSLRARHGPNAANIGIHDPLPGGYLGAKIAFGRIPDEADFSETRTADSATQYCTV
ncbi:hypothetical protein [Erythrobacter aureus]|uniref:hypothetical protein n=1 Tax=Erythrobacter aureus TaxID=2182384 RepID=UPI003A91052E